MKNLGWYWLWIVLLGLILLGASGHSTVVAEYKPWRIDRKMSPAQEVAPTPTPAQSVEPEATAIPEERILPPVGGNAGLILGGSVLVLIIIGGVMLFSRRKARH